MDYAIFKSTNGKQKRLIHSFKQSECNHQAKRCARAKLSDMWLHVLKNASDRFKNADGHKPDEFSYDFIDGDLKVERIRFYIDPL